MNERKNELEIKLGNRTFDAGVVNGHRTHHQILSNIDTRKQRHLVLQHNEVVINISGYC
jgi:hypothetical protein